MLPEEDHSTFTRVTQKLDSALSRLFTFGTRTARQKALSDELKQLSANPDEQVSLKQEYLIRESKTYKEKNVKLGIDDFEVIKVLGMMFVYNRSWRVWSGEVGKGKEFW
jgi:hypothetical protein